jgi:predicted DNA-binding transcriptional regulator AlpA
MAILGARPERTIRLHELPVFLGVQRSQVNELIKKGLLHPRPAYPGARAQVVTEAEVVALQKAAAAEAEAKAAADEGPIEIAPNRGKRRRVREAAGNASGSNVGERA